MDITRIFLILSLLRFLIYANVVTPCIIEGTQCRCDQPSDEDSLANLLTYCCQNDIFHVQIHGSHKHRLTHNVFYDKPCHRLVEFRLHTAKPLQANPYYFPKNGQAFNGLPNLETLHLTGDQRLTNLPELAFAGLNVSLRLLNLSGNALNNLEGSEFLGLAGKHSRLTEVDLSNNRLSKLSSGCFASLQGVQTISLAGNNISELRPDIMIGLELVEVLNLRGNPITAIIGGSFRHLTSLRNLFISGPNWLQSYSGLDQITPAIFYGLTSLRKLTVSRLRLSSINIDTFLELRQLTSLDLSENQLDAVPSLALERLAITQRSRLQELNLSGNRIKCLPSMAFSKLARLRKLDLSSNQLTVIGSLAFKGLTLLAELNLMGNPIQSIDPTAFDYFIGVDLIQIVHHNAERASNTPVVRLPPGDGSTINGLKQLKMRTIYGHNNEYQRGNTSDVVKDPCPALPILRPVLIQPSTESIVTAVSTDQLQSHPLEGFVNMWTKHRFSIILVAICILLTLVVVSATILSCQGCRRRRRAKQGATHSSLSDEGKMYTQGVYSPTTAASVSPDTTHQSINRAGYNSLEAIRTTSSSCFEEFKEKMTTSERLFTLGKNFSPPPYPHNMQTVHDRLLQTVGAQNLKFPLTSAVLMDSNPTTTKHQPPTTTLKSQNHKKGLSSGDSSPSVSNLGSSPRFSSSSSVQRPVGGNGTLGGVVWGLLPADKPSISPLHESGIVSDNGSSLITSLGIF